ncbi:hypothetical protein AMS68_006562 [Peltaster fructicola]|uniref:Uncharacterized protein n=1 Tax=Peltaster fructicola TaxID=286661 RepID=A0A6H0Y2A1_9PEZI|nr:hypothetical protein AMS68_006562 [Peltaster fructicola]
MEANGYIYPPSYRKGMSKIWKLEVDYWWLPEGEGLTPLLRSMRQFIDFRAKSAQRPPDDRDVDVRDMAGVFRHMTLASESIGELAMTDA